jgi:hypothetical protein
VAVRDDELKATMKDQLSRITVLDQTIVLKELERAKERDDKEIASLRARNQRLEASLKMSQESLVLAQREISELRSNRMVISPANDSSLYDQIVQVLKLTHDHTKTLEERQVVLENQIAELLRERPHRA